jgi:DNA repair protein RadC
MEIFESVFILLLNQINDTIGYAKISQGGIAGTVVDVRLIAKYAVDSLATAVILAHNHPTGELKPSDADIKITEKVKNGLQILDIKVLDHVILTKNGYYSFADEGII